MLALANATISAPIVITGMPGLSGLGASVSGRMLPHSRAAMPFVLTGIATNPRGHGGDPLTRAATLPPLRRN